VALVVKPGKMMRDMLAGGRARRVRGCCGRNRSYINRPLGSCAARRYHGDWNAIDLGAILAATGRIRGEQKAPMSSFADCD